MRNTAFRAEAKFICRSCQGPLTLVDKSTQDILCCQKCHKEIWSFSSLLGALCCGEVRLAFDLEKDQESTTSGEKFLREAKPWINWGKLPE